MNAYPNTPRAWTRTRGLARRAGVDLAGAVVEGWLTRAELDGLVCRCAACERDDSCTALAPDLPTPCTRQADLDALRL